MRSPWKTLSRDPTFQRHHCAIDSYKDRYIILSEGHRNEQSRSTIVWDARKEEIINLPDYPIAHPIKSCSGAIMDDFFYVMKEAVDRQHYLLYRMNMKIYEDWEGVGKHYSLHHNPILVSNGSCLFLFSLIGNEMYDPNCNRWTVLPDMTNQRLRHATAVVGHDIYVLGGVGRTVNRSVEIFNVLSQTWRKGPDLPVGLYSSSAALIDGRWIVLIGGRLLNDDVSDQCFILDVLHEIWIVSGIRMRSPRAGHCSVVLRRSQIVVLGNDDTDTNINLSKESLMEGIDIAYVVPNWCLVGHLVLLRHLVDNRRAYPALNNEYGNEYDYMRVEKVLTQLMTDLDLDIFRTIVSFLIPPILKEGMKL